MQTMIGDTQITVLRLGWREYTDHGEAVGEHTNHPEKPPIFGEGAQCYVGMWRREANRLLLEVE